jgi:hypothetical protein
MQASAVFVPEERSPSVPWIEDMFGLHSRSGLSASLWKMSQLSFREKTFQESSQSVTFLTSWT